MNIFRLLFIFGALSGLEASALSATNGPFYALSERIALADHIIATNWAAPGFGEQGFSMSLSDDKIKGIIKAVSAANLYAHQEHPDWEWDWQLQFYHGTNLLAAVCFARDTFLSDGVYRDASGVLEKVYRDSVNQEYVARVYKDEDKEFGDALKAEAKQWLRSPTHSILGEDKRKVLKYVNQFYAAGAAKVLVTDIKTQANGKNPARENAKYLCVVLPREPEARRKVFRIHWQAVREWCNDADGDVGQKYLWYRVDWHDPESD